MLLLAVVLLLFQGVVTAERISEDVLELCYSEVESCVYNNSADNSCNNIQELYQLQTGSSSNSCLTRSFTLSLTQELLLNVSTATVKVTLDGDKNNISNCENEDMCEALDSYIEMVLDKNNVGHSCDVTSLSEDEVRFSCAVPEFSSDGAYVRLYVVSNTIDNICVLEEIPNAALVLVQDSELIKLHVHTQTLYM